MYLDPSFGSMLIQVVVAAIAGGLAFLFMIRDKIRSLFKKKVKEPEVGATDRSP